jgi:hypothetical protein
MLGHLAWRLPVTKVGGTLYFSYITFELCIFAKVLERNVFEITRVGG